MQLGLAVTIPVKMAAVAYIRFLLYPGTEHFSACVRMDGKETYVTSKVYITII